MCLRMNEIINKFGLRISKPSEVYGRREYPEARRPWPYCALTSLQPTRPWPPASDTGMATVGLASLDPNLVRGQLQMVIRQCQVGVEVASVEGVNNPVLKLHVRLRHRLVRQLHGQQALSAIPVELDAGDLAVSHRPYRSPQEGDLGARTLRAGVIVRKH
jgi:hypothetical protein